MASRASCVPWLAAGSAQCPACGRIVRRCCRCRRGRRPSGGRVRRAGVAVRIGSSRSGSAAITRGGLATVNCGRPWPSGRCWRAARTGAVLGGRHLVDAGEVRASERKRRPHTRQVTSCPGRRCPTARTCLGGRTGGGEQGVQLPQQAGIALAAGHRIGPAVLPLHHGFHAGSVAEMGSPPPGDQTGRRRRGEPRSWRPSRICRAGPAEVGGLLQVLDPHLRGLPGLSIAERISSPQPARRCPGPGAGAGALP